MTPAFVVVWDGRRNGPNGPQLLVPLEDPSSAERHETGPIEFARAARGRDFRLRVLEQLRAGDRTMRELAYALGVTVEAVNSALAALQARGEVVKTGKRKLVDRVSRWGRSVEAVYGVAPGGRSDGGTC